MKTKTMARIFSFLLAFCLVAQLIPAVPAAVAADGTITYTFGSTKTTFADVRFDDVTTGKWEFNEQESHPRWAADGMAKANWANMKATLCQPIFQNNRDYLAFDIIVEKAGYYNATLALQSAKTFDISINGKYVATTSTAQAGNSLGIVYLYEGINTLKIKYNYTDTSSNNPYIWKLEITPASESEISKEFSLDFTADDVVTTYDKMTIARQGIRYFPFFTTSDVAGNSYSTFSGTGRVAASLGFGKNKTGYYGGFDFNVNDGGTYDIVVLTDDNPNHGTSADVIINGVGASSGTSLTGDVVATIDNAPNLERAKVKNTNNSANAINQRAAHLISDVALNAGMNMIHFRCAGGSDNANGVWNFYFYEAISLVNKDAVSTTAGEKMTFAALNESKTVTVTAPARGIYYVYLNAKKQSGGFGGYATVGGIKQYVDFSEKYYTTETVNDVATRPIGPVWLSAGNNTLTLQEIATANSTLDIDSIEVHEIKKNLWMTDKTAQNYGDVKMTTHGWEVDEEYTTKTLYDNMTKGSYGGAIAYPNAARETNYTDINLTSGNVGFKFNVPVAGTYKIDAVFGRRNANTHDPIVKVIGTNLETKVVQYNASGTLTNDEEEIGVVYLEEGENTIVFENSGEYNNVHPTNGPLDKYLYLKTLSFTPYDGLVGKNVSVSLGKNVIDISETTTATAKAFMSDDSENTSATFTWESTKESVAKVDENGNITPVGAGTTTITATTNILGNIFRGSAEITVKAPANITNKAIFGDVSAYITKDGNFVAFSGIDTTENYKEVGFYIALDDGSFEKYAVTDGKVYKSINVKWGEGENDKRTIAVGNFFTSAQPGEDAHIFFRGTALGGATTVKFYPYAVPIEGEEITGYTYSVSLS